MEVVSSISTLASFVVARQLLKATRASRGSAVAAVVEENGHVSLLETDVTVELGEAFGD